MNTFAKLALVSSLTLGIVTMASAHEGECPYCKLKLVQNTKDQDNEVVVKFGNKRIEYRCVWCVVKDAGRYKNDLVVYAPSEKVGEPVVLKRTDGKWSAPANTVFLNTFKKHVDCCAQARAFATKDGFDKYVAAQKLDGAKPYSLDEFVTMVAKPDKGGQ